MSNSGITTVKHFLPSFFILENITTTRERSHIKQL